MSRSIKLWKLRLYSKIHLKVFEFFLVKFVDNFCDIVEENIEYFEENIEEYSRIYYK